MYGPATPGWKQSLMWRVYRHILMLFRSRQLAQINLTSMSLIKFPHWSLAPLLLAAYNLIPFVLGDGLWRAAGAIFILLHYSTLFSLSWLTTGVPSDLHLHLLPDPNRTHVMSRLAVSFFFFIDIFFRNHKQWTCVWFSSPWVQTGCLAVSPGLCVWALSCGGSQSGRAGRSRSSDCASCWLLIRDLR